MTSLDARTAQASNTVPLDSHAAGTLRYIRQSMEAATAFAVPGSAGIAMGGIGLLAALLSSVPKFSAHWLGIWLIAALVAALAGSALVLRPASLETLLNRGTPIRKFALCLSPSLLAGAVLTAELYADGVSYAIPSTWLLLYGCALISASVPTRRVIGVMGACFLVLGLMARILPLHAQILLLGAGFGGLHLVFGIWMSRNSHGRQA